MLWFQIRPQGQNVLLLLGDTETLGHIWSAVSTSCWQGLEHPQQHDIVYKMKPSVDLMSISFSGAEGLQSDSMSSEAGRQSFECKQIGNHRHKRASLEGYILQEMTASWQLSKNENTTAWISGCSAGPFVPRPWLVPLLGPQWNDIPLPTGHQSHCLSHVTAHLFSKCFTSFISCWSTAFSLFFHSSTYIEYTWYLSLWLLYICVALCYRAVTTIFVFSLVMKHHRNRGLSD